MTCGGEGGGFVAYTPVRLQKPLEIRRIYTVHYFEFSSDYVFPGEEHDFWELLYVDKGNLRVVAGERALDLGRGQIVFHAPGEFHALSANGVVAPNLVVVSFDCPGPEMEFFRGYTGMVGAEERALLARIIRESGRVFSTPLNAPFIRQMERRESVPFGGEQLLAAAVEELLIRLRRRGGAAAPAEGAELCHLQERTARIIQYLESRLDQPLSVRQICQDNLIGRAQLERIFHEQTGGGVIDYFGQLKMEAARQMIREGRLNISQISLRLGFSSVHYFSRWFKKRSGMTPSEYTRSIKMLSELRE